jgi:hypothetical protein
VSALRQVFQSRGAVEDPREGAHRGEALHLSVLQHRVHLEGVVEYAPKGVRRRLIS